MRFGLPALTLNQIQSCFARYSDIEWVKVYGSRALGNYQPGSDIDLAYGGPEDYSIQLASSLAELSTPYLFDVSHYDNLQNENLKSHIDRVGQVLFTQDELKISGQKDEI
jgi:predicted nucleotidyltransferase